MANQILILGSASPRRMELLTNAGIKYQVRNHSYIEESHPLKAPDKYVKELSFYKAKCVDISGIKGDVFVLGVDTIVYFDGCILGKPSNNAEALHNIQKMSGKWHSVYSGVSLLDIKHGKSYSDYSETKVKFTELDKDFIKYYIAGKHYEGFAGGYAIQGLFSLVVEKIDGSYSNVVGLPMERLYSVLNKAGFNLF